MSPTTHRHWITKPWVIAVFGITALLCMGPAKMAYDLYTLWACRLFIEEQYASQIALIEQKCTESTYTDNLTGEEFEAALETEQQGKLEIGSTLTTKEVFDVSWSADGQHDREGLRPMSHSIITLTFYSSTDSNGLHRTLFGRTPGNQPLVIFEGRVEGGRKRQYEIVFFLDGLNSLRARK